VVQGSKGSSSSNRGPACQNSLVPIGRNGGRGSWRNALEDPAGSYITMFELFLAIWMFVNERVTVGRLQ
jgi:hypothetical protein